MHQQDRGGFAQALQHRCRTQAQHCPRPAQALEDGVDPGGQGGGGPVAGCHGHAARTGAGLQVAAQRGDAGEFRVGPLFEQLAHHPALQAGHGAVGRVAAVPVRHRQPAARPQHPQQFIGVALLVGHVGTGLHAPHGVEAAIRQGEIQGIHHLEAAAGQAGGGQRRGAGDLGWTNADPKHVQTVIAGQDAGTAADAAAHVQHP